MVDLNVSLTGLGLVQKLRMIIRSSLHSVSGRAIAGRDHARSVLRLHGWLILSIRAKGELSLPREFRVSRPLFLGLLSLAEIADFE